MQWHSCPGSGGVTVPGGVQSHGDVALRDVVSGHGGGGLGLDLLISALSSLLPALSSIRFLFALHSSIDTSVKAGGRGGGVTVPRGV